MEDANQENQENENIAENDEVVENAEAVEFFGAEIEEDSEDDLMLDQDDILNLDDITAQRGQIAPMRRFGDIFIEAFRRPLRMTRQFRIHQHTDSAIEDEDEQDEEINQENAENFDTDLPAEHSYLGNMSRVSGVNYLEVGKLGKMVLLNHKYLVFPGETLPLILPNYVFDSNLNHEEGLLFGLSFPSTLSEDSLYGVTCQIYEKGNNDSGNVVLKSKAYQRFIVTRKDNPNFDEITSEYKTQGYVRILPEIYLPDPLGTIELGSMNRFRGIPSLENKLRSFQASTTVWPTHIYEPYRIEKIVEKAKIRLETYEINSMPNDPILLSFWLGRNVLFNARDRLNIFATNSVNIRMQIIGKSLDKEKYFCCARCRTVIANCNSLFAMSKHGVQSNYINPGGCIHETNTVHNIIKDSVRPNGMPSTQFSWFPGYSWQIILCRLCDLHLGWKFNSTKVNLIPKFFYGLSGSNIKVFSINEINPVYFQTVPVS